MREEKGLPERWREVGVFLVFLLLAGVMTWPLLGRLGSDIPGGDGDGWVHLWTFAWVKDALLAGQSPLFTRQLFYPHGVSLLFHNIAWVNIALWLPLQAVVGEASAYSLVFLFVLAFNGFAQYLLAREISGSRPAAFIGGLIVAFWPYILSHNQHPNLVFIAWVPLTLLFLRRTILSGRLRHALLAGLALGLLGITRYQLLVIGGVLIGTYVLYLLVSEPLARTRRRLALLLLAGSLGLATVAPFVTPVLVAQAAREDPEELFVDEGSRETDLLAYFFPNQRQPLWGEYFVPMYKNLRLNAKHIAFLGLTTLLLAAYGTVKAWPISRFWLLALLLYMVLALGSSLHVNGQDVGIPLPYALVDDLFIAKLIRRSDRLNVILSIPIGVLAGLGMAQLRQRLPRLQAGVLTAGAAALILLEYATVFLMLPLTVPSWYQQLANEPGQFGIVSVPMHPRWGSDKLNMMYQLTHGKPLVEGHVSRPPEEAFAFIERVPMLAELRDGEPVPALGNPSHQLALLREANVRYLILHLDQLSEETARAWRERLIVRPAYADEGLLVYRTEVQLGRDFTLAENLLGAENELGIVRQEVVPSETTQSGWIEVYVDWGSGAAQAQDYDVCLSLLAEEGDTAKKECVPVSAAWPTSRWEPGEVVRERYLLQVDAEMPAGVYGLRLGLQDEQGEDVGRKVALGQVRVAALARTFTAPRPAADVDAVWGEEIALVGYDLRGAAPAEGRLVATLYWQGLREPLPSYKFFLHLLDPASGQVVAQVDWVPRDWLYPTTLWQAGEYVADTVAVDLAGVPAGDYQLSVGIYEPDSGERLEVGSISQPVANRSLLLEEVTVE